MLENMSQENISNLQYGDISYKFFVTEEGKFDHAEIAFTVKLNKTINGTMNVACEFSYKGGIYFKDIGTTVVTAPIDAEDYTSMNFPSLT